MDVIDPYATNEPLSHCYATIFFFPQSQVIKLCENNFSQKKLCESNTANLLQTNKNLYFYILSQK